MVEEQKVVTLPSAEEIMKRLKTVQDDGHVEHLYLRIAREEGHSLVAQGVVMMFVQLIYDEVGTGMYANLMYGFMPAWIDALIDDKEVAEKAKAFLASGMKAIKTAEKEPKEEISLKPPITRYGQARAYIEAWVKEQGFKGEIKVLETHERNGRYEFDLVEPYGIFFVDKDGSIEDNYNTFVPRTEKTKLRNM